MIPNLENTTIFHFDYFLSRKKKFKIAKYEEKKEKINNVVLLKKKY